MPADPPPDTLLGPGQQWVIKPAPGWTALGPDDAETCGSCRKPAVATQRLTQLRGATKGRPGEMQDTVRHRCAVHMDSNRWVQDGRVVQWRADPPWRRR